MEWHTYLLYWNKNTIFVNFSEAVYVPLSNLKKAYWKRLPIVRLVISAGNNSWHLFFQTASCLCAFQFFLYHRWILQILRIKGGDILANKMERSLFRSSVLMRLSKMCVTLRCPTLSLKYTAHFISNWKLNNITNQLCRKKTFW